MYRDSPMSELAAVRRPTMNVLRLEVHNSFPSGYLRFSRYDKDSFSVSAVFSKFPRFIGLLNPLPNALCVLRMSNTLSTCKIDICVHWFVHTRMHACQLDALYSFMQSHETSIHKYVHQFKSASKHKEPYLTYEPDSRSRVFEMRIGVGQILKSIRY